MRVLLVSHALPKDAWPGAKRISWMLDLLPAFGVETRLLVLRFTRTKRSAGAKSDVSKRVTIVETHTRDVPGTWASLVDRDGGFERTMVADPGVVEAVCKGGEIVGDFEPHLILATTPSPRNVEVGYRISTATGVPIVIDWRDPASLHPMRVWPSQAFYEAVTARERTWVEHAQLNVTTAPSYAHLLSRRYPGRRVAVVTNGWEPVSTPTDEPPRAEAKKGTLLYSGSLVPEYYGFARHIPDGGRRLLLNVLSGGRLYHHPYKRTIRYHAWGARAVEAIARNRDLVSCLKFLGAKVRGPLRRRLVDLSLWGRTECLPWVDAAAAARLMRSAHVLWLCRSGTTRYGGAPVIMTKAFDYLASGRPIFAALPPECDTAEILRGQAGVFLPDPGDPEDMVEALRGALSTAPDESFERDVDACRPDRLAERLFGILTEVVGGGRR